MRRCRSLGLFVAASRESAHLAGVRSRSALSRDAATQPTAPRPGKTAAADRSCARSPVQTLARGADARSSGFHPRSSRHEPGRRGVPPFDTRPNTAPIPLPHTPSFEKPQFLRPPLALFLADLRVGQQAPSVRRPSLLLVLTRGRQSALNAPDRGAWREGGGKEALSDASGRWAERGSTRTSQS